MDIVYRCANTRKCYWLCRECLKGHTHRCSLKCPDYLSIAKVKRVKKQRKEAKEAKAITNYINNRKANYAPERR